MTGVKPDDTCATAFDALKAKKESRFILFTITADGKHISVVEKVAPAGTCAEDWAVFAGKLNGDYAAKCCYAVFDFDWEAEDGHSAQKIMFVLWSPEGAKVKDKMMTTGSKDALKKALVGVGQDFQATDSSEITYEECLEKAKSAVRRPASPAAGSPPVDSKQLCTRLRGTVSLVCLLAALVCIAVNQRLSLCERGPACGLTSTMWWLANDKLKVLIPTQPTAPPLPLLVESVWGHCADLVGRLRGYGAAKTHGLRGIGSLTAVAIRMFTLPETDALRPIENKRLHVLAAAAGRVLLALLRAQSGRDYSVTHATSRKR
jgi:cofilin|eukprot:COSAG06_NODE_220_length_19986_cov_94.824257_4_plen_318_part_00